MCVVSVLSSRPTQRSVSECGDRIFERRKCISEFCLVAWSAFRTSHVIDRYSKHSNTNRLHHQASTAELSGIADLFEIRWAALAVLNKLRRSGQSSEWKTRSHCRGILLRIASVCYRLPQYRPMIEWSRRKFILSNLPIINHQHPFKRVSSVVIDTILLSARTRMRNL